MHISTLYGSIYSNNIDGSKQIDSLAMNIQWECHKR